MKSYHPAPPGVNSDPWQAEQGGSLWKIVLVVLLLVSACALVLRPSGDEPGPAEAESMEVEEAEESFEAVEPPDLDYEGPDFSERFSEDGRMDLDP